MREALGAALGWGLVHRCVENSLVCRSSEVVSPCALIGPFLLWLHPPSLSWLPRPVCPRGRGGGLLLADFVSDQAFLAGLEVGLHDVARGDHLLVLRGPLAFVLPTARSHLVRVGVLQHLGDVLLLGDGRIITVSVSEPAKPPLQSTPLKPNQQSTPEKMDRENSEAEFN